MEVASWRAVPEQERLKSKTLLSKKVSRVNSTQMDRVIHDNNLIPISTVKHEHNLCIFF